jgi:IstB-like ATP binding protein
MRSRMATRLSRLRSRRQSWSLGGRQSWASGLLWLALQVGDLDVQGLCDGARGAHQGRVAGLDAGDGRAADADLVDQLGLGDAALNAPVDQRRDGVAPFSRTNSEERSGSYGETIMQSEGLPPGTGKSHSLIGVGYRAVERGLRVRDFVAADLVEALYRGLADNTVGKLIHTVLRNDLVLIDELGFAPLDETGSQLLFRFVAAAYEHRSLGLASHWPFEQWGHFLPGSNNRGFAPRSPSTPRDRRRHVW